MKEEFTRAHLFLVTGKEAIFEEDRDGLGDFVARLNPNLEPYRWRLELHICPDEDCTWRELNAALLESKQPDKDLYLFVFYQEVSKEQQKALELGLQQVVNLRQTGEERPKSKSNPKKPNLLIFFRSTDSATPTVADLKQALGDRWLHYYNEYNHPDTLKLELILALSSVGLVALPLTCEGGNIKLNAVPILPTENLSLFAKNQYLQEMIQELHALEPVYIAQKAAYLNDPDRMLRTYSQTAGRKAALEKEITKLEQDIFTASQDIAKRLSEGEYDPRIATARQFWRGASMTTPSSYSTVGRL